MSNTVRIWTCATYHPAYRCGGWAAVRTAQGAVVGFAGGARNTTASRTALSGLLAALRDLPPGNVVLIRTASLELAAFAGFLETLAGATAGPEEDLDLWAQIAVMTKGRRLSLTRTAAEPGSPTAFTAAWADLAWDKVKATGAFASAIPKSNLAKIAGLEAS